MRIYVQPTTEAQARKKVLASRKKTLPKEKNSLWPKIALVTVIAGALIAFWYLFDGFSLVMAALQANPQVWAFYQAISNEIASRSLMGLFYASFFGSLFFISLPIEIVFLYYLGLNYYVIQIFTIVMVGNLLGMLFNYGTGRLVGDKWIRKLLKEKYVRFRKKLDKAGAFIVLIGNIIPFPIEPFSVFLGAVKYNFVSFITWTIVGKVIKFLILLFGYTYFLRFAGPFLADVSVDWFIELIRNVFIFW